MACLASYIGLMLARLALLLALLFGALPALAQEVTEGQAEADYHAWLARSPDARAKVIAFNTFLDAKAIHGVIPTWQILRTASMWRECNGPRFEVPPFTEWQHIGETLRFIGNHVEPVIGEVEALSGYRNGALNECAGGAPGSAHRHYHALDLTPVGVLPRGAMMRSLCAIHAFRGPDYGIGLGFYSGRRFHVDSKRFRRWGSDGKGATSPCATGIFS